MLMRGEGGSSDRRKARFLVSGPMLTIPVFSPSPKGAIAFQGQIGDSAGFYGTPIRIRAKFPGGTDPQTIPSTQLLIIIVSPRPECAVGFYRHGMGFAS